MAALTQIRALRSHLFRRPAPVLLRAPQRTPKTPLFFREIPHDLRKGSGVFVSSAQVQERHAKPHAGRRVETRTFSPRFSPLVVCFRPFPMRCSLSSTSCRIFSAYCAERCSRQNNSANAAHSTPTIRGGTAPHSPPESPKARRCGSVDGLFRRVGQRLPTFFISGCVPRSGKCA